VKRILAIAILLTVLAAMAPASWWSWQTKPFGNTAGNKVAGTGADTLTWTTYVGTGGFRNAEEFAWRVRADSSTDSIPAMSFVIQYKPDYLFGVNSWQAVKVALDSAYPLDGSQMFTWRLDTTAYFMPRIASFSACSVRAILTGLGAYQAAKNCSLSWRIKK